MILKKPYAFLIKNFKLIHIILFFALSFLIYKSSKIYNFFNDYVNGNYFDFQENLVSSYIDIFLFLTIIVIILFSVTLYWLMKVKNKNKKYYLLSIVYYFIVFILFVFYLVYLANMKTEVVDEKVLRIVRDSSLMMLVPQYIFAAFSLFRGLGFDLKTFNFAKDLDELDISSEDSEEFEIVIKDNGYKVKRSFRKFFREIYYYIIENRQMILIVIGAIIMIILGWKFIDSKLNSNMFSQGSSFYANGFQYKVTNSYFTSYDNNGNEIKKGSRYMVVNFNVTNNNSEAKEIDLNNIKLIVGENVMYPILNKYNYFIDLGDGYKRGKLIQAKEKQNYILVFEVKDTITIKDPKFRIVNLASLSEGRITTTYSDSMLTPINSLEKEETKSYNMSETIELDSMSSFKLKSFNIRDEYEANYKYCADKNCFTGVKILQGNEVSSYPKSVIRLSYDLEKDKSSSIFNNIESSEDFLNSYAQIEYTLNGKELSSKLNNITPSNVTESYYYFEAKEDILKASKINFVILIRNKKYEVNIK